MDFKDYYATLGLSRTASADEVRTAYRRLARKYHPDVSKEPDAEARFKELGEANEVLKDPGRRAAYDAAAARYAQQKASGGGRGAFQPPPPGPGGAGGFRGRTTGADPFATGDYSEFFESLFGRAATGGGVGTRRPGVAVPGADQRAKVEIDLEDAFRGARRSITLRVTDIDDDGQSSTGERTLDLAIPRGIREGQQLRLAGQGGPGVGGAPAGDLYLEVAFRPHPRFRVDGRDVQVDLPVAPWEAALGAAVTVATPEGPVELTVPAGSVGGRRLRLRGRGIPGSPPGDLHASLRIVLPPADTPVARAAYERFRDAVSFDPRESAATGD